MSDPRALTKRIFTFSCCSANQGTTLQRSKEDREKKSQSFCLLHIDACIQVRHLSSAAVQHCLKVQQIPPNRTGAPCGSSWQIRTFSWLTLCPCIGLAQEALGIQSTTNTICHMYSRTLFLNKRNGFQGHTVIVGALDGINPNAAGRDTKKTLINQVRADYCHQQTGWQSFQVSVQQTLIKAIKEERGNYY